MKTCKIKAPFFEIGPKSYLYGDDILHLALGEFAHIYFIDWDHVRARPRQVNLTLFGTTEDMGDRKYNNGEVVNTLRKFPAEEKAYMAQYDEWKIR